MATGKKTNSRSSGSGNCNTKKPSQPTIYVCPYTNQNVYIGKATLKDLKSKSTFTNSSKRLWTLPSPQTRNELYVEAAKALATREQALLPSFGGRSWEVTCKLTEPHWSGQVLFRAWKGKMELAVLPHLLEKIPTPPTWPGRKTQPDEYEMHEDEEDVAKLQQREVSSLSSLAWDLKDSYPVPNVTLKWQSPERKVFNSRKAAWEHATMIAAMEVEINKCILGIGSSGKLLKPFLPSVAMALKVGKLRFERDGLWVVGQELAWQEGRPQQLLEEEQAEEERKRIPKSGLELYLMTKRNEYREAHADCKTLKQAETELRKHWKTLSRGERNEWNKQVRGEEDNNNEDMEEEDDAAMVEHGKQRETNPPEPEPLKLSMTPQAFYVKSRRHEYREERRAQNRSLSLSECDIWLRQEWKTLDPSVKAEWEQKLIDIETKKAEEAAEIKRQEYEAQQATAAAEAAAAAAAKEKEELEQEITSPAQNAPATEPAPLIPATMARLDTPRSSLVFDVVEIPPNPDRKSLGVEKYIVSPSKLELKESEPPTNDTVSCKEGNVDTCFGGTSISQESPKYDEEKKDDDGIGKSSLPVIVSDATTSVVTTSTDPSASTDDPISDVESNRSSPAPVLSTVPVVSMPATKPTAQKASSRKQQVPTKQATHRWCLNQGQIDLCYAACMDHYETVMRTVKTRDLHRELQDGFDVLRERGYGRYDMELPAFDDSTTFGFLTDMTKAPWMPVVKAILGDDAILIHKGCFLSMPGSAPQEYHQDGVHLTTQTQRPCHAINVFVPLVDLTNRNGPTEFCLGSHILGLEGYDRDFVEIPKPTAGTPVIFDYRLGHRGLGNNTSRSCRPIVYCTYARAAQGKEFRDSVNFSRKRYHKIGELSSKPLSREERQNKRKRDVHQKEQESLQQALEESLKASTSVIPSETTNEENTPKSMEQDDEVHPQANQVNMMATESLQQEEGMLGEQQDNKLRVGEDCTWTLPVDEGGEHRPDPKRTQVLHGEAISMVIETLAVASTNGQQE